MSKTNQSSVSGKYDLPDFLKKEKGDIKEKYKRWLDRKARNIRRRDGKEHSIAQYKEAIHRAVNKSEGIDVYTGEKLKWKLLGKCQFNNKEAKEDGRSYKKRFALSPSVDHDRWGKVSFKICSLRTNDAKSDLSYRGFLNLCKKVIATHRRRAVKSASNNMDSRLRGNDKRNP